METETEKTFIPEPGDYISAVIDLSDGNHATYRGYVVRQAHGYSPGQFPTDPIVFDANGKVQPNIEKITVMRGHDIAFSYIKYRQYESTLDNIIQDENHLEFDFKQTPINIPPETNDLAVVYVPADDYPGGISDGYHTFDELYYYRMLYNAIAANMLYRDRTLPVFKSKKHHDGTLCFDGKYFVVQIDFPNGYVANHYELKYWDLFRIPEQEKAPFEYDGSTPSEEAERIHEYLKLFNRFVS